MPDHDTYRIQDLFVIKIISLCTDASCPKSIKTQQEMPSKTLVPIKTDCFSIFAWGYFVPFSKLELGTTDTYLRQLK